MGGRKKFVDIAKGILILFVAYAHSPINNFEYINWFHMPAFLILSGYTFSMPDTFKDWFKRSAKRLLLPYASFYMINIILMLIFVVPFTVVRLIKYIGGGVLSGRVIPGVFWFITTFLLMQIVFILINKIFKNKKIVFVIIIALYIFAHFFSSMYYTPGVYDPIKPLPMTLWNIDVVPMMLFYFSIGYFGKSILEYIFDKIKFVHVVILAIAAVAFYVINDYTNFNYWLNLKYGRYNHLVLDAVIPCVLTILVIGVSIYIQKYRFSNILMTFGMYTFPIMYLHIPINETLKQFINVGPITFMIVSIVISYVFIIGIKKNKFMGYFFNGKGNIKELFNKQ